MEDLPQQCNYLALGAARIREIKSIVSKLDNCEHGGRVFQKLPRHMQRRAVSSNPRRLPRYLREKHLREGGDNVKQSRRPSRKYRRRPSNLLQEYARRSKEHVWLETHIWHAKRFHMRRQWGYALPDTSTCRGHRASLRAATTGCLLQDVSYLCCIELEGAKSTLLPGLSKAMLPESLAVLTHPKVMTGRQWMSFMFFQPGRQPYGALTEVDMLFHPLHTTEAQEEKTKLWLWIHPSSYLQVVEALAGIFHLEKVVASNRDCILLCTTEISESQDDGAKNRIKDLEAEEVMECKGEGHLDDEPVSRNEGESLLGKEAEVTQTVKRIPKQKKIKKIKDVNSKKLETRNVPFERTPKFASGDKSIVMTLLKDTLNRFRLLGPRSYSVLSRAFLPASVVTDEKGVQMDCERSSGQWWKQYFGDSQSVVNHQKQTASWEQLASCTHLPSPVVLPLTVRDPRVTLPSKKVPMEDENSGHEKQDDLPEWPVDSPLYISDFRDQVTLSKEPDAVLNQRRSHFLVPGSHMPETPEEARLPLLLLSRPPTSAGLGGGWEVVVPAGWGMNVFLPLVFHGAVVAGQHEAENLHLETLTSLPSHLLPDTPAGSQYSTLLAAEKHKEFFKRPPASRPNYIKLGVQFPFNQPWHKLLQAWQSGTSDFFVLRDSRLISSLSSVIANARNLRNEMNDKVSDDSSTENLNGKPFITTNKSLISNGSTSESIEGVYSGKRKADDDLSAAEAKRAKQEDLQEKTHHKKVKENEGKKTCNVFPQETGGLQELEALSSACLVMVQLVLAHKGTLEPCSMVCLPKEEDYFQEREPLRPRKPGEAPEEPQHKDLKHDHRARMREEHIKIKARMRRVRRKARKRVAKEMDIVSATHSSQSMMEATSEALKKVEKENKVIISKCSSYKDDMECSWLMNAGEPLQCCARRIMGYITHGTFSHTHGRAAGIGWVGMKPLLDLTQQCMKYRGQKSIFGKTPGRGKGTKCLPVLVRNPTSLQYRWAHLSVVEGPCLGASNSK